MPYIVTGSKAASYYATPRKTAVCDVSGSGLDILPMVEGANPGVEDQGLGSVFEGNLKHYMSPRMAGRAVRGDHAVRPG